MGAHAILKCWSQAGGGRGGGGMEVGGGGRGKM